MKNKIYIETLGCSKNLVDSEHMTGILLSKGYEIVDSPDESEFVIINTCSFVNDAKKESIDAIFNMINNTDNKVIVTGCLAQRYAEELTKEIPEVVAYVGTTQFQFIDTVIENVINGEENIVLIDNVSLLIPENLPRKTLTPKHYAFVKISEGCDNRCTYCIIPQLRGDYRSRKIEDIVIEVRNLVKNGVKEVILIAQDTTRYGIDIYNEFKLGDLLDSLNSIEDLKWIRIQYMYPDVIDEELILSIKRNEKVVSYFDIPIQHSSNKILKLMNRHTTRENIIDVLNLIKMHIPDAVIRTTLIVGFPGETDEDFNDLIEFITENPFNRLGAFKYSDEENTPAYNLPLKIDEDIKEQRYNALMSVQIDISNKMMMKFVDRTLPVIIDEVIEGEPIYMGRTEYDTPEVDGVVYVHTSKELKIGNIYNVHINDSLEYDLIGEI